MLTPVIGTMAQSLNDGQYSSSWEQERDAIATGNSERVRWQEDYYYRQMMEEQRRRNVEMERKVREAAARAQQGSQTGHKNSSNGSGKSYTSSARVKKQQKKARREAEHRQWLAERDAARAAAAARAAEERRRREEREREDRRKRYNEALLREYQRTEATYMRMHSEVNHKATIGFQQMMNAQPIGTERIRSQYVASQSATMKPSVSSIVSHSYGGSVIALTGHERSSLNGSDYDKALERYLQENKIGALPSVELPYYWGELDKYLDSGQVIAIRYLMLKNNGMKMPDTLATNNKGEYLFQSSDSLTVFKVTSEGTLQILRLENHFWEDDNIIKKIKENGLKKYFSDSFKFSYNKGGSYSLRELSEKDSISLKRMLPQVKAEIKMSLFNNNSKLSWKEFMISQEKNVLPGVMVSGIAGGEINLIAGPKAEVDVSGGINAENHVTASASAKTSVLGGSAGLEIGSVIKLGNRYYMSMGSAKGSVEIGVGIKTKRNQKNDVIEKDKKEGKEASINIEAGGSLAPGVYGEVRIGGITFHDITPKN